MAQQRTRSVPLCIGALAVALASTALGGHVIYRTTQMPVGDASGMQWVVRTPLALLFIGLVVPVFMFGIRGLRGPAASVPEPSARVPGRLPSGVFLRSEESRPQSIDLKMMLAFIDGFMILVSFILPISFRLLGQLVCGSPSRRPGVCKSDALPPDSTNGSRSAP